MDDFLLDVFIDAHQAPPERLVVDFDATVDPLHGEQEDRFFHGYYASEYPYMNLFAEVFRKLRGLRPLRAS